MRQLKIFIELTRLNKPIGFMLLFWPCSWSLSVAYKSNLDTYIFINYLILFFLGSVLMRSAGCIINDIVDKDYDKKVKRTNYLKYVMGFSSFGFLFNMLTVLLLYLNLTFYARLSFAFCCVCMIISIFLFLQEVRMSNEALKYHLSDMDTMKKDF